MHPSDELYVHRKATKKDNWSHLRPTPTARLEFPLSFSACMEFTPAGLSTFIKSLQSKMQPLSVAVSSSINVNHWKENSVFHQFLHQLMLLLVWESRLLGCNLPLETTGCFFLTSCTSAEDGSWLHSALNGGAAGVAVPARTSAGGLWRPLLAAALICS